MKANELRLGNYVDLGSRIAKIIEISHLSCVVVDLEETQDTIESYERTKPIPLTEEWLLKFGFTFRSEIVTGVRFYDFGSFQVKSWNDGSYVLFRKDICLFSDLTYVHQLQNLYFALCGEELILKEQ